MRDCPNNSAHTGVTPLLVCARGKPETSDSEHTIQQYTNILFNCLAVVAIVGCSVMQWYTYKQQTRYKCTVAN